MARARDTLRRRDEYTQVASPTHISTLAPTTAPPTWSTDSDAFWLASSAPPPRAKRRGLMGALRKLVRKRDDADGTSCCVWRLC